VPTHPDAESIERLEDFNCRQVLRLGNLLIRLRRYKWQLQILDESDLCAEITEIKRS
jgi:hypothetical protein